MSVLLTSLLALYLDKGRRATGYFTLTSPVLRAEARAVIHTPITTRMSAGLIGVRALDLHLVLDFNETDKFQRLQYTPGDLRKYGHIPDKWS